MPPVSDSASSPDRAVRHARRCSAPHISPFDLVHDLIGPGAWSPSSHLFVLLLVGVAVAGFVHLLVRPADVELLVDNIHVPDEPNTEPG